MANDNTVNVEITASVAGLKSGLSQAEKGIKGFGTSTDKMTSKTNKMAGAVKANAVPSLTAFSQVIQDAPYGIRGVANNITQLTSQFGYLSKSAGGSKAALKAMIGSLAGPAGILFAISAVTSLMVSYDKEIKNFIFGTDESKVSIDRLNDALREQINLRKLLKDELSVATSIAVAEAKLAGKSLEEQYSVRKKYSEANIQILETQYKEAVKTSKDFYQKTKTAQGRGDEDLINQQKAYSKDAKDVLKSLNDAKAKLYLDDLNEQIRIQKRQKETVKTFLRPQVKAIETSKPIVNASAEGYLTTWKNTLLGTLGTAKNELAPITTAISSQIENAIPTTTISEKAQQLKDIFSQLGEDIKGVTQSGIYETIANMSFALGDALGSGGNALKAVGQAMLGTLGDILIKFGELSLAAGIAATALGQALKNPLNPANAAAAIAAGAALIAIGGAVKAFSSSIGGKSASESDTGSYSGSSSSNYSSGTSYASSSGGGGTYVFEIAGTKLIGVLKNTLDRNKQLGGSNNLIFG